MTQDRDPFKAGLFVLAGLLLSGAVIIALTDFSSWLQKNQKVEVSFALSDGLRGLRSGSIVSLGDQPVGVVTQIGDELQDGRVIGKRATIKLPAHYKIADNAVIQVVVPTFGTGTSLNIISVGNGKAYAQGDVIPAGIAPNLMARQLASEAGIGTEQREQMRQIIANLLEASGNVRQTLPALSEKLASLAASIEPLAAKAGPAIEDAKVTMANVKEITEEFRKQTPQWSKRIDEITLSTQETVNSARDILKDKDVQIRETLDNAHIISTNFREKTMALVDEAVTRGSAAMENLQKSSQDLRGMIVGQRPVIERALANAELTTDQLKLAAIEVRRAPWRLMYKPEREELETDNLYDAARSFALAASTLDAAAGSLKAVSADKDNPEQVERVLDHLTVMFERYETAEKAFWEALKNRTPGPGTADTLSK